MRFALDDFEYRAPARYAIRISRVRAQARELQARLEAWRPLMHTVQRWLAALAAVLLYLLVCAWMQNAELREGQRAGARDRLQLETRNAYLEAEIAEAMATRGEPMFYVLEAGSPREARDKLQRLGMMIAKRHYELGDATPALVVP
jgi:hypothetical protein